MRLILLTLLTMVAFAANSLLTRMAVDGGHIDPSSFALIRVVAGAVVLAMISTVRGRSAPLFRMKQWIGAVSLAGYMIGFSLAYLTLDAGLGALILFGVVQMTMFVHGARQGSGPTQRQMTGAAIAFAGLLIALWPGPGGQSDLQGALFMTVAGLAWAAYTIQGRTSSDPIATTTGNFLVCCPLLVVFLIGPSLDASVTGIGLAILCGGLTSGVGYALWYSILPKLDQNTAAIVQLSVPIIAIAGGAVFLSETIGWLTCVAAGLVVGGIALSVTSQSAPTDHT
ncbi:MAG: DMT family transporter [Sulfitobacter sp.]